MIRRFATMFLLGILWLIHAGLHFIPGLILLTVFAGAATFLPPTHACCGAAHSSGKAGATDEPLEIVALRALHSLATGVPPIR